MAKNYVGDIGVVITLDCGSCVSAASSAGMEVKKPSRVVEYWDASIDGETISVTTEADDLEESGVHFIQSKITMNGLQVRGETAEFTIYELFE